MRYFFALLLTLAPGLAYAQVEFVCREGNYKIRYPKTWKKMRPPDETIQLAVQRGGHIIMVTGSETNSSLEELLESAEEGSRMMYEDTKELGRKERKVAGERAVHVTMSVRNEGIKFAFHLTIFTHQGIAYRVVGLHFAARAGDFDDDYDAVLDSFTFLSERKEWLAKYEGKPARTALLGGLATFELNRPRWTESTFDDGERPDYTNLDFVRYKFMAGGAWVSVRAHEAVGDAAAELNGLQHFLASRLQNMQSKPTTVPGPQGNLPAVEITGTSGEFTYLMRATTLVTEGIATDLWLECQASQQEATRRDWEQLVRGFRLQPGSKPEQPLAYPLRRWTDWAQPNSALAVFLPQATLVTPRFQQFQLKAISPDGKRAFVAAPEGAYLENLTTRRREPLSINVPNDGPVAWSRDGKRLAFAGDNTITLVALDEKKPRTFPGFAMDLTFGPADDELLVCVPGTQPQNRFVLSQFVTSRLESIRISTGVRRTLLDFPLGRVAHPAVAPDGKRIALVTNHDYPRTAPIGGHLYVCNPDGGDLRQLTRDPEDITAVTWSADGQRLYAVRRLAVGEDGAVGAGGSQDLYQIALSTGAAVNLTRSGRIGRVWSVGPDLLVEISAWDIVEAQRGVFRVNAATLEKATTARPVPPVADVKAQSQAIAAKVRAALGNARVQTVTPTPELLERLAKAFASAASEACGCPLDFSAASLDQLPGVLDALDVTSGRDPALVFAAGAYYGETLRRTAGATWQLQPVPFGEWTPGLPPAGNPFVQVVLPFSDPYRRALRVEDDRTQTSRDVRTRVPGQKLILVYPPAFAEEAVRGATPASYREARKLLDAGRTREALDLLARDLLERPKNGPLAQEVIAIGEAARLREVALQLTRQAVEAGNEVPELLIRYADALSKTDPKKALEYYRKAAQADTAPAEALFKLGEQYAALGRTPIAEACWRRAYSQTAEPLRQQIRSKLGMDEEKESKEP